MRLANQKINTILADYGDVVPRREYEMLEASYKVHILYYRYEYMYGFMIIIIIIIYNVAVLCDFCYDV